MKLVKFAILLEAESEKKGRGEDDLKISKRILNTGIAIMRWGKLEN